MELTLTSGRVLNVTLKMVTHKEFARYWGDGMDAAEKEETFKKIVGITPTEADDLPEEDWRAIRAAFAAVCWPPDPKNSPSASTSTSEA